MKKLELLVSSILAGLLIGVSGAIYLGSGKIPFGAVLFSVALFTICTRGMALFTGRVGYLVTRHDRMVSGNCWSSGWETSLDVRQRRWRLRMQNRLIDRWRVS